VYLHFRYLDENYQGGTQLFPKDPKLKALTEQWISVEHSNYKCAELIVAELLFKKWLGGGAPNTTVVEENTKKLNAFLTVFNKELEGKTYLVGDTFTAAGITYFATLYTNNC
jgi:glutathione S-transferase